tara:strand:- start:72 stop:419 length:348 start_codon:yes stop_codon:yes gene_type:complete
LIFDYRNNKYSFVNFEIRSLLLGFFLCTTLVLGIGAVSTSNCCKESGLVNSNCCKNKNLATSRLTWNIDQTWDVKVVYNNQNAPRGYEPFAALSSAGPSIPAILYRKPKNLMDIK